MSQYDQRDREREENWAKEVHWEHNQGPYPDYGWEKGQSVLPEFRDPDVHVQPYERQRVSRWRRVDWNEDYNYGVEEYGPYSGVGPKDYHRSDQRIFEDVCERLTRHGRIDARNIRVSVKDGEVTLDGTVRDRQTKRMAEDVADHISGVQDVHNQLHLDPGAQPGRGWERNRAENQTSMPGGGRGRVDEVGGSGVYPASGPMPKENASVQGEASWGQGERGSAGYEDSGRSEMNIPPENRGKEQK
jgi:osmotically-inducible protein OsmY